MSNIQSSKNQTDGSAAKDGSAAGRLIKDIIRSGAILFHDERKVAYMAYNGNGSEIIRVGSGEFKEWLHHRYWTKNHQSLPRDTDTRVAHTLAAFAIYEGPLHPLDVRTVKNEQGLWYDLGDGHAVHITAEGWRIVSKPPILFRQFDHQQPQVHPEPGGNINHLLNYINIRDDNLDDQLLFLVNLVATFIPGFPHPILILFGPQGAGKSTPMRLMKKIIDPSGMGISALPTNVPEFVQIADHHAFIAFDNLSSLSAKMSDALARASTGDGFSKRKLWTDDGDIIYYVQRPFAINGINQVVMKPDLLDRSILIELERIAPENRLLEEDYWQAFEHDRPQLLGGIFDVLAKAMAIYPTIELSEAPRMADFTKWGCAIAEAAGYSQQQFLNAYRRNISRQNEQAIEASPVARAVIVLMEDRDRWEGTASELMTVLENKAFMLNLTDSRYWPKDPPRMGRMLNEVRTTLSLIGIRVDNRVENNTRIITITKNPTPTVFTEFSAEDIPDLDEEADQQPPEQSSLLDDDDYSNTVNTVGL